MDDDDSIVGIFFCLWKQIMVSHKERGKGERPLKMVKNSGERNYEHQIMYDCGRHMV